MEESWNNFKKTIFEDADGVLGEKVKTSSRNISKQLSFYKRGEWICTRII